MNTRKYASFITGVLSLAVLFLTGITRAELPATGGDHVFTNTVGSTDYIVHVFTNPATNTFTASGDLTVDVLIVGGGGGGGGAESWGRGGGGGAGGLICRPGLVISNDSYSIVVGDGGAGTSSGGESTSTWGDNGEASSAFSMTALGGGGGGVRNPTYKNGRDGGSGGGGTKGNDDTYGNGGEGLQPSQSGDSGTYGRGNDGAGDGASISSGGGGGAGTAGNAQTGGDGLSAVTISDVTYEFASLFGTNYGEIISEEAWFAGGGAGENNSGGQGGGGNGADGQSDGMANTGGGGAGRSNNGDTEDTFGGDGGSGIVMIRYQKPTDTPVVETAAATGLSTNGATLNGTLSSTGTSVTAVSVFWQQGGDQGETTGAWANVESFGDFTGALPHDFATNITGLAAGTTYYYRYYATNDAGEAWGAAESFTTYAAPTVPTIDAASETGFVHVVISGAVNGGTPDPLAYFCLNAGSDGGTGSTGDWDIVESAGVQSGAFTNMITGLQDDTNYYARVYVTNEAGAAWSSSSSFTTKALPDVLVVDGDQEIGGSAPELSFVEPSEMPLEASGTAPNWTFDFSTYGGESLPLNLAGHTLTYTRPYKTSQGLVTFNLDGGAISNAVNGVVTNGLSLKITPQARSDARYRVSDSVRITNVTAISMGGIDTAAALTPVQNDTFPYGGAIVLGTSESPVSGAIRVDYLNAYAGEYDYGNESAVSVGGNVTIYGGGDVMIADSEGVASNIMTWSSEYPAGNVTIVHQGHFQARAIETSIFSAETDPGSPRAGNITLDGGNATGNMTLQSLTANNTSDDNGDDTGAAEIVIKNYANVAISGAINAGYYYPSSPSAGDNRHGGNVTMTDGITGDITLSGVIDLKTRNTAGNNGTLRLTCAGAITLAELDLDKVLHARLDSGSGNSTIEGAIADFDVSSPTGSGTQSDPYVSGETRLRAPEGQVVYYEYQAGTLNTDLGGDVWQLRNLDDSGDGGLLMVEPPSGTIFIVR